ncbi:segment polarity protein dishevelled homolog DVL-2-like [Galendromus occidentalis]|uniref:Segment polarity protein dishevelled homolog DVL-2-like n=1 Tax=Galendromus occidentalis TaxID=34638 RepID=A0AAJ6QSK9_9ACAR|nr:segment polarity protein dishevelled homolog DVL-2-like [Galendromus occidentalis]
MAGTKRRKVETKVCFHIDEEETPYLVKLPIAIGKLTLKDFKRSLPRTNFKFFFKSVDPEFGVVKEEITNDSAVLPSFKGRVVSWLVTEKITETLTRHAPLRESKQLGQKQAANNIYEKIQTRERLRSVGSSTDSESIELRNILEPCSPDLSSRMTTRSLETVYTHRAGDYENYPTLGRHEVLMPSEATSTLGATEVAGDDQNLILVELTLTESTPSLGIHVADSPGGDLLIDRIIEGSLVCLDGRIGVGDKLLKINGTPLQHLSSSEATNVMRSITSTTKEVALLIGKRSQSPYGKFIRPIDPGAWVAHTEAALQEGTWENDFAQIPFAAATSTMELTPPSSTVHSWGPDGTDEKSVEDALSEIVSAMARANSGLRIKDRKWLSFHFRNAAVGTEIVDWLQRYGAFERKHAKLLAENMFKGGLIRNPLVKKRFKKKSIYTFCEEIDQLYQKSLDERI